MAGPSGHEITWPMIDRDLDADHDDCHSEEHSGEVAY
jgi:hypothetical protein